MGARKSCRELSLQQSWGCSYTADAARAMPPFLSLPYVCPSTQRPNWHSGWGNGATASDWLTSTLTLVPEVARLRRP